MLVTVSWWWGRLMTRTSLAARVILETSLRLVVVLAEGDCTK